MAFILVIVSNSSKIFALGDLGLTSSNITSDSFDLNWNAITPDASSTLDYYEVFQDGTSIATTSSTTLTYSVIGLSASTTYVMKVDAVVLDESASSSVFETDEISVTTSEVSVPTYTPTAVPTRPSLSGEVIYDSIPNTLPSNLPSLGYQATQTYASGDKITFAPNTGRALDKVAVTLSSWACENGAWTSGCVTTPGSAFNHPITINLYKVADDGTVGDLIASRTQTFEIPYRPSTDTTCPAGDNGITAWRDTNGDCFNGLNNVVVFDMSGITVPDTIIYSVAYDTQSYGENPIGTDGPYSSLNVSLSTVTNIGTNINSDEIFWDTTYPSYTRGLKADTGWNSSGNPAVEFTAVPVIVETIIVDKNNLNGWSTANLVGGTTKFINDSTAPLGTGALRLITDEDNNSKAGLQLNNLDIDLSKVNTLSYKTKQISAADVTNGNATIRISLNLNGDGSTVDDQLMYEPYYNGFNGNTMTDWQTWTITPNSGKLWSNWELHYNGKGGVGAGGYDSNFTISDVLHDYPNAKIVAISVTMGTWNKLQTVLVDSVNLVTSTHNTTYDFEPTILSAPTLISPIDNAVVKGDSVTNVWSQVVDAIKYEYQSFNDAGATSLRWQQEFASTSKTATNVADSVFYWRVRAIDEDDIKSAWSSLWKLTIDNTAPIAPTNLSWTTAKGNVIANGGTTKEVSGTASWDASVSSDVDHYIYKYWNAIDGNQYKVGSEYTTNVNGVSLPGTFNQGEGTHYYCVVAVDAAGNESDCSDPFEITYTIDRTAPAAPTILAPVARQWLKSSPILNAWSEVTKDINGDDEEIDHYQIAYNYDDGHTFGGSNTCPGLVMIGVDGFIGCRDVTETTRSHQPADNEQGGITIWVRAIDVDGNAGAWSKSVHYYFDKTAPATDINVSSVVDGKFTVSGTATDNLALNRVYVQLVSRTTNDRCGGTTVNLITSPFSTSSPWSVDYDISTLKVTGTSTACVDGNFAAHVSVTDMAGNSSTAGWTENFMVTTPENNGGDDNEGGDDNSTTTPPTTPASIGGAGVGSLLFTTGSFSTPITTPAGQVLGATAFQFTKDLKLGSVDDEVKSLQKFLNLKGFTVATSGAGSLGNETRVFGPKTKAALIKYQEANPVILTNVEILDGKGTGNFFWSTREFVNDVLLNDSVTSAALEN